MRIKNPLFKLVYLTTFPLLLFIIDICSNTFIHSYSLYSTSSLCNIYFFQSNRSLPFVIALLFVSLQFFFEYGCCSDIFVYLFSLLLIACWTKKLLPKPTVFLHSSLLLLIIFTSFFAKKHTVLTPTTQEITYTIYTFFVNLSIIRLISLIIRPSGSLSDRFCDF